MTNYQHWDLQTDSTQVAWLALNRKDTAVNLINYEVLNELNVILQDLGQRNHLKGLIIYSTKAKGFIALADDCLATI